MNIYNVLNVHFICKIGARIAINVQIIARCNTYRDGLILNRIYIFEKYFISYALCGRQIHIRACEEATLQLACDNVNKLAQISSTS